MKRAVITIDIDDELPPIKRHFEVSGENPFPALAYDILKLIFRYLLHTPSDMKSAAKVCKLFHKVCNDPSFWEHIDLQHAGLNGKPYPHQIALQAVRLHSSQIKTIDLSHSIMTSKEIGTVLQAIFRHCKNLKCLSIADIVYYSHIRIPVLETLPALEILNLSKMKVSLSNFQNATPNLKKLYLTNMRLLVRPHEMTNQWWPSLEVLDIRNSDQDFLANHPNLKTLLASKIPVEASKTCQIVLDNGDNLQSISEQLEKNKEFVTNVNIINIELVSLLHMACYEESLPGNNGLFQIVKQLLKLGANPNLNCAGDFLVNYFDPWKPCYPNPHVTWGSKIDSKTIQLAETPTGMAILNDCLELLELLLRYGAKIKISHALWLRTENNINVTQEKLRVLGALVEGI